MFVPFFPVLPYGSSQLSRFGLEDHMHLLGGDASTFLLTPQLSEEQPDNYTLAPVSPEESPVPFLLFVMAASVTMSIRFPSPP